MLMHNPPHPGRVLREYWEKSKLRKLRGGCG
jgi:hypothetical protein